MARNTRTPEERARDRVRLLELRAKGWCQEEIAQELGVSQQQVSHDALQMRREWQARAAFDVESATGQELERLDMIEAEAWAAWRRSCQELQRTATTHKQREATVPSRHVTTAPDGTVTETSTRETVSLMRDETSVQTEQQNGNPAFLALIGKCVEQRAKLLGLNKPERIKISGDTDAPLPVLDLHNVTRDELVVLRRLKARALSGPMAEGLVD